ncbi:MAG: UMP kinase [Candidatus Nanoarchaeia archaeon]|nr:UMP kinase [Candidatus Nanoarchaeia archaeon]
MKTIVVSVGGSMIVPDKVDYNFLVSLRKAVEAIVKKSKIVICTGGGSTAREYISILRKAGADNHSQDIAGIDATRLNARLVASFLSAGKKIKANQEIPKSLNEIKALLGANDCVVCGGLGPGKTSDGTTAEIAGFLGADTIYNMTNVKGLYTKDPRKHRDAKFIPLISHEGFRDMMVKVKEKPGQHFVLDSEAERITREKNMEVVILQGAQNLQKAVEGKKFEGTIVE